MEFLGVFKLVNRNAQLYMHDIMFSCMSPDPIDLTGDGDQDLQKALALSLQDMNQPSGAAAISLEEQELSR